MIFFGHSNFLGNTGNEISMSPLRFQVVTPEEFIEIYNERRADIRSARIIAPKLGEEGFGKILIEWKNPPYAPMSSIYEGALSY